MAWRDDMKRAHEIMARYRAEQSLAFDLWPQCAISGCPNKCCRALDSQYCFIHTTGNKHVKHMKIDARNFKLEKEPA